MEYKETELDLDNRFTIVRNYINDIRKSILLMLSTDDDRKIIESAKNVNQNLTDIEKEYYKVFRELATEQVISKSLIDVIENLQHPAEDKPVQERGETEVVESVEELPFVEESQDEAKVKEVQDEKVTNILDKIVKVGVSDWKEVARKALEKESASYFAGREVYYIPPPSSPFGIDNEPGSVRYLEAIDKNSLNYLLIKTGLEKDTDSDNISIKYTTVIDVEDEEVVMDYVEGRDRRYRYLDTDNKLTQYAKFIIKSKSYSDGTTVYVKEDEPSFKEQVKQKLLKDTIYNNGDIRYYLVSGIPSETYGSDSVAYIEGFDAETLEYLLIEERSGKDGSACSEVLIRTEDEEELRRHVEGKPFTFKYITPDGKLTNYSKKSLVKQLIRNNNE